MKVFSNLKNINWQKETVATLGTFDGVHIGHMEILSRVVERSKVIAGRSFVITFEPHPRKVLNNSNELKILTTIEEKEKLLREIGIENLLVINFTNEFSQQTPDEFIKKYLIDSIGLSEIVIGYDHHFGKSRGGNEDTLKQLASKNDFKIVKVEPLSLNEQTISSTKIRRALSEGDVTLASKMLGRYYSFSGLVVEGDKRGRELGYPTANIKLANSDKMVPSAGIYFVSVELEDQKHFGLLSVGKRPTFYDDGKIIPEVYIYNFNKDIYGKFITVNLIERLRAEEKFSSAQELIDQMNRDKAKGIELIKKLNNN
ncbi:MAG: bifunctional riboflavin kinase/FAD synthetase [Ignavibacteriaceae bacterium]|nr:bifunctional riboflavin kinase/FAD synthetase [Ignavibacteriaceae bacterium]